MTIQPDSIRKLRERAHIVITHGSVIADRALPNDEETWHDVGSGSAPAFENGWENYSALVNPCGYRKDASGFVHLRGTIRGIPASGSGGFSTIFTLPASWRPVNPEQRATRILENQVGELSTLYIRVTGEVCLQWPVAGSDLREGLYLDNYRWKAVA